MQRAESMSERVQCELEIAIGSLAIDCSLYYHSTWFRFFLKDGSEHIIPSFSSVVFLHVCETGQVEQSALGTDNVAKSRVNITLLFLI